MPHSYNLRERPPPRTDPELTAIADALPGDVLLYAVSCRTFVTASDPSRGPQDGYAAKPSPYLRMAAYLRSATAHFSIRRFAGSSQTSRSKVSLTFTPSLDYSFYRDLGDVIPSKSCTRSSPNGCFRRVQAPVFTNADWATDLPR